MIDSTFSRKYHKSCRNEGRNPCARFCLFAFENLNKLLRLFRQNAARSTIPRGTSVFEFQRTSSARGTRVTCDLDREMAELGECTRVCVKAKKKYHSYGWWETLASKLVSVDSQMGSLWIIVGIVLQNPTFGSCKFTRKYDSANVGFCRTFPIATIIQIKPIVEITFFTCG